MTERSRSHIKVFRKGHLFVLSALRLLLLNMHKKFEDGAIARFCCSACQPLRRKSHGNHFNNNIDQRVTSSVNKYTSKMAMYLRETLCTAVENVVYDCFSPRTCPPGRMTICEGQGWRCTQSTCLGRLSA